MKKAVLLNEKDKLKHLVPVRFTSKEIKALKKLATKNGQGFMTRMIRKLVLEAIH